MLTSEQLVLVSSPSCIDGWGLVYPYLPPRQERRKIKIKRREEREEKKGEMEEIEIRKRKWKRKKRKFLIKKRIKEN